MRKTIVTVTLLVMLAVSCEIGSVAEKAEYTEDGQRLVTVKVNIDGTMSNSRSLSNASAKTEKDFVEVIFKKGDAYYRAQGYYGESLSIKLPKAKYPVTDAVILIGKKNTDDYTLLAIGTLSGTLPLDLTSSTPSTITFSVASGLTAALNADADSPAFVIADIGFWGATSAGISKEGKYGTQPSFQVPISSTTPVAASLSISGFPTDPTITLDTTDSPITYTARDSAATITAGAVTLESTPPAGTKKINLAFTTATTGGDYIITFKFPVAFNTDDKGLPWVIRGGTKKNAADASGTTNEGILLAVLASPYEELVDHTVGSPNWP